MNLLSTMLSSTHIKKSTCISNSKCQFFKFENNNLEIKNCKIEHINHEFTYQFLLEHH